jgi:hypothetical protein
MTIKVIHIKSILPLGTQNGINYVTRPSEAN